MKRTIVLEKYRGEIQDIKDIVEAYEQIKRSYHYSEKIVVTFEIEE